MCHHLSSTPCCILHMMNLYRNVSGISFKMLHKYFSNKFTCIYLQTVLWRSVLNHRNKSQMLLLLLSSSKVLLQITCKYMHQRATEISIRFAKCHLTGPVILEDLFSRKATCKCSALWTSFIFLAAQNILEIDALKKDIFAFSLGLNVYKEWNNSVF